MKEEEVRVEAHDPFLLLLFLYPPQRKKKKKSDYDADDVYGRGVREHII